jgi:hypothetical protein
MTAFAASPAAYGVLLRDPLNPAEPALPQATALPCVSVIVIIVLLKVAWMCAIPWDSVRFSLRDLLRRDPAALFAILFRLSR